MEGFVKIFVDMFESGGVLMYPLAILASYLYYTGFKTFFRLRAINKICSNDSLFNSAYTKFVETEFDNASGDIKSIFGRLRLELLAGIERRLLMLKILSSVAPLIGLLGTVSGMMLSISSAAGNTSGVADGISKALITTQAGLVIAIPSWILAMVATSQMQTLLIKIAQRETAMIKGGVQ